MGGSSVELFNFEVSNNVMCGIQIGFGEDSLTGPFTEAGEVDLHNGSVHGHPTGVNIQVDGYDVGRLEENVLFFDNERNLDSYDLPIPDGTVEP